MPTDPSQTELEFEIKSLDQRQTSDWIPEIEAASDALQSAIAAQYPGATITVSRKEGTPVHAAIQYLLVHVNWHDVALAAEKAATVFATTEFLKFMKSRFRNVFAKPKDTAKPITSEAATTVEPAKPQGKARKPVKKHAPPTSSKKKTVKRKNARKKSSPSRKRKK